MKAKHAPQNDASNNDWISGRQRMEPSQSFPTFNKN